MLKTVYVVYKLYERDNWDEIRRFYNCDKAIGFAEANAPSRIDIDTWEITHDGRELVETLSDWRSFPVSLESR